MKIKNILLTMCLGGFLLSSCTDLEEEVLDGVELEQAASAYATNSEDAGTLLSAAYGSMRNPYQIMGGLMCLNLHTTDAMVGPTRGGDWDDAGVWRQLHAHTFSATHGFNRDTYNAMYNAINSANLVIGSASANAQQIVEARFLKAMHYYNIIDLWGSAAYREIGSDTNADALVYTRAEATDWVISELEAVLGSLPAGTDPTIANQNAAHWLLAKLYLNYGVFTGDPASPTFDNGNMDKVISNIDAISGVSLAAEYWDNFIPANSETSTELILVSQNIGGSVAGLMQARWYMTTHYSHTPSGWNGFTTLAEYYNKFDPADPRIYTELPTTSAENGYNVGFLVGQQYGLGGPGVGEELMDRLGNKLVFTKEIQLITGGATLESAGVRGIKYVPDNVNPNIPDNDFVIARYADALLMKAEALSRKGDNGAAQAVVQQLANESTTTIGSADDVYAVRARELWWEGWRRNDMIRFGTFLNIRELKPIVSDPKFLLMPIPLAGTTNPNITQNPGY